MSDQFPMPTPTIPNKPLTSYRSLSFDIYETLIQWESSIVARLEQLASSVSSHHSTPSELAKRFAVHEAALQTSSPDMKYDKLLTEAYLRLAAELGAPFDSQTIQDQAVAFGNSIGDWPPYPDTLGAMDRLGKHYKLIVLSNVDGASFAFTNAGPLKGLKFWRIFTAEDIGFYKPNLKNFEYLLRHLEAEGIAKEENVHVAQSLHHDHRPAKKMEMPSVWINRTGAGTGSVAGSSDAKKMHENGELGYGWRFGTLGDFADEVERQFAQ